MATPEELKKKLEELEAAMQQPDFWQNKDHAQAIVKEYQELKDELENGGSSGYDKSDAIMTILSGAGGDDSEDFSRMLLEMYQKFFAKLGFETRMLHSNENNHGGYRNVTVEVHGKGVYGTLKHESGVHRLVRVSPFSAKSLRHTSFSMVEIIPKLPKTAKVEIPDDELKIEFARSSGPGGQNVNKRETAVRVVHLPTNLSAHSDNERSQAQNREKAMEILRAKVFKAREEERMKKEAGMYVSKTTEIEWGNQIRSYVLHPYKMVKDHRTDYEESNVDSVLDGNLEGFIESEQNLPSPF